MTTASVFSTRPWLASYAPNVPADIVPPRGSLVDMIDASIRANNEHVALEFFGMTTTYRDMGEQISRAANGLRKLGVRAGDRVALVLPNCPQHIVA